MKRLQLNQSGHLLEKDTSYFGGEFSFIEKLARRGVGSSKVIYDNGIEEFDELFEFNRNDIGFVNFELFKNGLVIRVNKTQRVVAIGLRLTEVEYIKLVAYRIELRHRRKFGKTIYKIVHRGELEIGSTPGEKLNFAIVSRNFKSTIDYFQKKELVKKFSYSISLNPPEKDYGYVIQWIEGLL